MAKYNIIIKPTVEKQLDEIPKKVLRQIITRINGLETNPRPPGIEKLSGQERYRVRQGDYRIVYGIDDRLRTVEVVRVGHRREVYR